LFIAICVYSFIVPSGAWAAVAIAAVSWLIARALINPMLRWTARLLWRHGRWASVRLEGGWYMLWRAPYGSSEQRKLAEQILREFPAKAKRQLRPLHRSPGNGVEPTDPHVS